jgi:hypothetical protein
VNIALSAVAGIMFLSGSAYDSYYDRYAYNYDYDYDYRLPACPPLLLPRRRTL